MPTGCLGCASGKTKKNMIQYNRKMLDEKRLRQNKKPYRFQDEELLQFNERFMQFSDGIKMSHKNYKESLGIFGIDSLSFLSDRMFTIMDKHKEGEITLE